LTRLYLTTPIYYVNGDPHIGHAHTTIMADILKRASIMRGTEVFLTTGTDEHGQKNQEAAEKSGLTTEVYLEWQSDRFRKLFDTLDVSYDLFVRTTRLSHMKCVQEFERRLKMQDLLVEKPYTGLYCVGCEQFKKPTDLDEYGRCVDHLILPERMSETNWFMRIEQFRPWLRDHISSNSEWLIPGSYRKEVLGMLEEPLDDLCISRPKSRVQLGIDIPFDDDYVTYVWFDALINYLSNIGWPDAKYSTWWDSAHHLVGKDIIKTHCIYWPIMLRALGIEPPKQVSVHGFWLAEDGHKMSKSLHNVVDPFEIIATVGTDALRYFLARQMRGSSDSLVSKQMIVSLYNTELANKIGNLLSRLVKLASRHFDGRVPTSEDRADEDVAIQRLVAETATSEYEALSLTGIPGLMGAVASLADRLNAHVDATAPWNLAKRPESRKRLASCLYALLDSCRLLLEMLQPIIPSAASRGLVAIGAGTSVQGQRRHNFEINRLQAGALLDPGLTLFPKVVIS
jgi:methionyl-tRNA synthetase